MAQEEPAAPKEPHRLESDYKDIEANPIEDVKIVSPFETCTKEWVLHMKGPSHTPYHNGVYKVVLQFTPQFPQQPPACVFKTKIYHPLVREDGFGRFWIDVAQNVRVRQLINMIYSQVEMPYDEDRMYINKDVAYIYENQKDKFRDTARNWCLEYGDAIEF